RSMRRDPVVAPPLVVVFGRRAVASLDDQPLLEHPLDGAVERAGAQFQLAVGVGRDVLNDRVAVAVFTGQGEQDVEGGSWQHALNYSHSGYILKRHRRAGG